MKSKVTRRVLSLLLTAAVVLGALPMLAVPGFAAEDVLSFSLNDNGDGYIVTKCDDSARDDIVIPSEYNGLPVTEIGCEAFNDCASIKSVKIPNTVTHIGENAFSWCSRLVNVEIPEGVNEIGMAAFSYCGSLVRVVLPEGLKILDSFAFENCDDLLSVNMPGSLEEIGFAVLQSKTV